MIASAPNKWRYGGLILRARWNEEHALIPMWNGMVVDVRPDDVVTLLRTGAPYPILVGVEHKSGAPA